MFDNREHARHQPPLRWDHSPVGSVIFRFVLLLAVCLFNRAVPAADGQQVREKLRETFSKLDSDENGNLSLEEYVGKDMNVQRRTRDFRVFDLNGNKSLDFGEFSAIPGSFPAQFRGAIPDPFDFLLEQSARAMDLAYGDWDKNPTQQIDDRTFVINFAASISPDGVRRYDSSMQSLADADGNGRVSREEARRFLKIQLGILAPDGTVLREPNGLVLFYPRYNHLDVNKDGTVSREEFIEKDWRKNAGEVFDNGDLNKDGKLTMQEYANPGWISYEDVVGKFLNHDTNYDGKLSSEELATFSPENRVKHLPYTIPQFDDDGDNFLSLAEFQFTMFANRICWWEKNFVDSNRDGTLSFDEFTVDATPIDLIRRLYFHRLDGDGDGKLSDTEFEFSRKPSDEFHLIPLDGSAFQILHSDDEYVFCGSPDQSPDGKTILCDGRRGGESLSSQQILRIDLEGDKKPTPILEGMMPVWSPDGKQFCCSRNRPESGIWLADADGSNERKISDGWGAQWSPDGQWIAFTDDGGVWLYEVKTEKKKEVLTKAANPYQYIYYNAAWSPDSRRLCFKGTKNVGAEIASIDVLADDPDLQVHFASEHTFDNALTYSADGKSLFFSLYTDDTKKRLVHELKTEQGAKPVPLKNLKPDVSYSNVALTQDGKSLIATAHY
ncbi:MAG: PD40 domain-containing protein [Planctomycetaceae bacterium]|nr:PD40 domain-containing protein [Planctomycetaceae bacterium]